MTIIYLAVSNLMGRKNIFDYIYSSDFEKEILSIVKRHPMRLDQIIESFSWSNFSKYELLTQLEKLKSENKIQMKRYNNQIFWKSKEN